MLLSIKMPPPKGVYPEHLKKYRPPKGQVPPQLRKWIAAHKRFNVNYECADQKGHCIPRKGTFNHRFVKRRYMGKSPWPTD